MRGIENNGELHNVKQISATKGQIKLLGKVIRTGSPQPGDRFVSAER
jgi:hypothetical protein